MWRSPAVLSKHLQTALVREHFVTDVQITVELDAHWVVLVRVLVGLGRVQVDGEGNVAIAR